MTKIKIFLTVQMIIVKSIPWFNLDGKVRKPTYLRKYKKDHVKSITHVLSSFATKTYCKSVPSSGTYMS